MSTHAGGTCLASLRGYGVSQAQCVKQLDCGVHMAPPEMALIQGCKRNIYLDVSMQRMGRCPAADLPKTHDTHDVVAILVSAGRQLV